MSPVSEKYKTAHVIATGPFGEVWKCDRYSDTSPIGQVAIKILAQKYPEAISQERLAVSRIMNLTNIPGIIPLSSLVEVNGGLGIVMMHASSDLLRLSIGLSGHRLELSYLLHRLAEIARTLDGLASYGLAHCGLSPNDILIHSNRAYLCDFIYMCDINSLVPGVHLPVSVLTHYCKSPEVQKGLSSSTSDQYSLCRVYVIVRLLLKGFQVRDIDDFVIDNAISSMPAGERDVIKIALSDKRFLDSTTFVSQLATALDLKNV